MSPCHTSSLRPLIGRRFRRQRATGAASANPLVCPDLLTLCHDPSLSLPLFPTAEIVCPSPHHFPTHDLEKEKKRLLLKGAQLLQDK